MMLTRVLQGTMILMMSFFAMAPLSAAETLPVGEIVKGEYIAQKIKTGTHFPYDIYIPKQYDPSKPAAISIGHDGLPMVHAQVQERLAESGDAPAVICVGLCPGSLYPTLPNGEERYLRAEEYDQVGPEYPNFIIDEFIPWLIEHYGLNISSDPNMHLVIGASSGGISAWNCCWYRNDYFRRCFMSSPTFSAFRLGNELIYDGMITETKPIRAYEVYGEHEPHVLGGDSFAAAIMGRCTLEYAGYDQKVEYFPGGGHGVGYTDEEVVERALRFLWANWETEPIKPAKYSDRVGRIVELGTAWEETSESMPEPIQARCALGTYSYQGNEIYLTDTQGEKRLIWTCDGPVTGVALSSDQWILYVSVKNSRDLYAAALLPDGTFNNFYPHSPLRLHYDVRIPGALGICVDTSDRLYAATELGIQSVIAFGLIDAILPLPNDLPADAVAFGGPDHKTLYAKSGDRVFKRPTLVTGRTEESPITPPEAIAY